MKLEDLKTSLKTLKPTEASGICDPSKLHLPQSQASIREGKMFHYKVPSELNRNDELNFLVNFILIGKSKLIEGFSKLYRFRCNHFKPAFNFFLKELNYIFFIEKNNQHTAKQQKQWK